MYKISRISFFILFLSCLFLTGCGGKPTVSWQGEVTVGGKPLPSNVSEAVIQVLPMGKDSAGPAQAEIKDGKYDIKKVPQGDVLVQFVINAPTGKKRTDPVYKTTYDEQKNLIPPAKRSGIRMTADKNNSSQNFDL